MEFLKGAGQKGLTHRLIVPSDLGISPCDGAGRCMKSGNCIIRDGMNDIYGQVLESRYLLIASPVYFMGPPGSLKAFIDRFQAVWARGALLGTFDPDSAERRAGHRAFAIITGATEDKPSMYRPTLSIIKAFLNVTGFDYSGELIATGLEGPADLLKREDLLKQAREAGLQFAS
jgi:multimeric flavodoxin WrbA